MKSTMFRDIVIDLLERRDGENCQLCGLALTKSEQIHVDHIVPKYLGGGDVIKNLQLTHKKCNLDKGANFVLGFTAKTFISQASPDCRIPLLKQLRHLAVKEALEVAGGKIGGAAKILGVDVKTMYRWRKEQDNFARSVKIARSDISDINQLVIDNE